MDSETFIRSVYRNKLDIVGFMLAQGADPNVVRPTISLLGAAVEFGYFDMVNLLLEAGADPNLGEITGDKKTPICIAIEMGDEAIVEELLRFGAGVDSINEDGESFIEVARRHGKENMLQLYMDFEEGVIDR